MLLFPITDGKLEHYRDWGGSQLLFLIAGTKHMTPKVNEEKIASLQNL